MNGCEAFFDGQRGLGGDGFRDLLGAGEQVGGRNDFFDQADAQGLGGGDDVAGEEQLERGALANEAR